MLFSHTLAYSFTLDSCPSFFSHHYLESCLGGFQFVSTEIPGFRGIQLASTAGGAERAAKFIPFTRDGSFVFTSSIMISLLFFSWLLQSVLSFFLFFVTPVVAKFHQGINTHEDFFFA